MIELVEDPVAIAITDRQLLDRLLLGRVVEPELEHLVFELLPPPLVGLGLVAGVVDLVGIVGQVLNGREVELLAQQAHDGLVPLVMALEEPIEDDPGEVDVPLVDLVVKGFRLLPELFDVGLQEVVFLGVQVFDEVVAPLDRDLVVNDGPSHVPSLKEVDDRTRGLLIVIGRDRGLSAYDRRHEEQNRYQGKRT